MNTSGGQRNRLFILLAIALLGLVCIGLVGLGGIVYLRFFQAAEQAVLPTSTVFVPAPTPTATLTPSATFSPTPLPTPTGTRVVGSQQEEIVEETGTPAEEATVDPNATATNTPVVLPTATSTPTETPTEVLGLPTAEQAGAPTATSTTVVQPTGAAGAENMTITPTNTPASELPGSGGVLPAGGRFLLWAGIGLLGLLLFGLARQTRTS